MEENYKNLSKIDYNELLQIQKKASEFLKYVCEIGINVSGQSKRITCKDINNYEFLEE